MRSGKGESDSHKIVFIGTIVVKLLCKCSVLRPSLFVQASETQTCKLLSIVEFSSLVILSIRNCFISSWQITW